MDRFGLAQRTLANTMRPVRNTVVAPDRLWRMANVGREPTPYTVVHTENKLELRYYEPDQHPRDTPILLTYPLINEPSILDFRRDRSVVRQFLDCGFEVYLIDWGDYTTLDAALTLDDFIGRYLANCVDVVLERSSTDAIHLHGYSTGVPLAVAYAALDPQSVTTLVLQGPPIDFHANGGYFDFGDLVCSLDPKVLSESFGTIPASILDAGLAVRKPAEYGLGVPLRLYQHFEDKEFVEDFARRATWAMSGMDLPGGVYRDIVTKLFKRNELIASELYIGDRRVDLDAIDMPVALVVGTEDAFIPPSSYQPFLDRILSDDTTVVELPTTHVGLSVAPEAHEVGWPAIREWLAERS